MTNTLNRDIRVIGVCDVSTGYGSPEIAALMHDFCEIDGASGLLLEPNEPDRPVDPLKQRPYELERLYSQLRPQSLAWNREFVRKAARRIDRERPDILIVFGGAVFAVLAILKHRPRTIIYHAYEQISDLSAEVLAAHRFLLPTVDLVTTPSIRRLIHDCRFLSVWPKKILEYYNSANVAYPKEPAAGKPRPESLGFLWAGALDYERTFADFFFCDAALKYHFTMFGRIADVDERALQEQLAHAKHIKHLGIRPADELFAAMETSAFSLAWWNPENSVGHYHLASNRFFSAIGHGRPPICGPHPQCIEINKKYECAIILEDWTCAAFGSALRRAERIFRSNEYEALVSRCHNAATEELSWKIQSSRLRKAILEISNACEVA